MTARDPNGKFAKSPTWADVEKALEGLKELEPKVPEIAMVPVAERFLAPLLAALPAGARFSHVELIQGGVNLYIFVPDGGGHWRAEIVQPADGSASRVEWRPA